MFKNIIYTLLLVPFLLVPLQAETLWLETEQFSDKGGWSVDPLFMDQMGSPFLLAHGLGTPVEDASTTAVIENPGTYNVWVRTRNWNSPWDTLAPGRFQLRVNDELLPKELGVAPAQWGWVNAGIVNITTSPVKVALHDLTGFDARCDAVVLTDDPEFVPPQNIKEIAHMRDRLLNIQTIDEGEFDLVVVGAGVAGLSTAISAAKKGIQVALVHNRPVLGGNNSTEIQVNIQGGIHLPPFEQLGNVVAEIGNVYDKHEYVLQLVQDIPNLHLFLNMQGNGVALDGSHIQAVLATNIVTLHTHKFKCRYVADCTGDGAIGYLAGAEYMMGRETRKVYGEDLAPEMTDNLSYGSTVKWHATQTESVQYFPETPWAMQFSEATVQYATQNNWNWETGFRYDQIEDFEYIRDYFLRVIYGNWSYIKNASLNQKEYENWQLGYVSFVPGKRESRRLTGDYILTQADIQSDTLRFKDGCVTATYMIDQHFPHPENTAFFPGEEFRSIQKLNYNPLGPVRPKLPGKNVNDPYLIPYRCLYSKNISNLFMAGRDISTSRIAFTSVRVQGTTGMMGEVVGMAAWLCCQQDCTPRDLYNQHWPEFTGLLQQGITMPHNPDFEKIVPHER